jgi:hypothetical protein
MGAGERSMTPNTPSGGGCVPSMGGGMSPMGGGMHSMGGGMSPMGGGMRSMSGGHGGRFTGDYMSTRGAANSRPIWEGSRGGQYYINANGNKSYLRK